MITRLTQTDASLALVVDESLLEALGLDAQTMLEVSTDGEVIVVRRVGDPTRAAKLVKAVTEAHERYGGVFKRLAE